MQTGSEHNDLIVLIDWWNNQRWMIRDSMTEEVVLSHWREFCERLRVWSGLFVQWELQRWFTQPKYKYTLRRAALSLWEKWIAKNCWESKPWLGFLQLCSLPWLPVLRGNKLHIVSFRRFPKVHFILFIFSYQIIDIHSSWSGET